MYQRRRQKISAYQILYTAGGAFYMEFVNEGTEKALGVVSRGSA